MLLKNSKYVLYIGAVRPSFQVRRRLLGRFSLQAKKSKAAEYQKEVLF